jgi:hypothetical protein
MFAIAIILIAQMGVGGIERRAYDLAYGRAQSTQMRDLLERPTHTLPDCLIGRKQAVSGAVFVLIDGQAELTPMDNSAPAARSWVEDEGSSKRTRRYLFRVNANAQQSVQRWRLNSSNGGAVAVRMFADDREIKLRQENLRAGSSWTLGLDRTLGGLTVTEGACSDR